MQESVAEAYGAGAAEDAQGECGTVPKAGATAVPGIGRGVVCVGGCSRACAREFGTEIERADAAAAAIGVVGSAWPGRPLDPSLVGRHERVQGHDGGDQGALEFWSVDGESARVGVGAAKADTLGPGGHSCRAV